ncbi:MAG: KpsF/GutQ family sugar-phosphate isomerase [Alphaproteobacteria bacterium]|nr:KpsF/GutQ family sugar-phosphate isomerase [Alphaproteobacteria bacterium]
MSIIKLPESSRQPEAAEATLETARRVLVTEGEALIQMSAFLNESFYEAIELISAAEGRVIITGMGKSGHVGKKIAATMASTGTPAFFVHPAEASHGDMGMIVRGDVVLALSNSGEAKELLDLIEYTRRFAIPLISITSKPMSTLGQRADVTLLLPGCPEACPNGLAPTTSTTMTMAMGDALAITLLERKGFTAKDFKVYHPGGKLGQQLMRVSEIMHKGEGVPVAPESVPVAKAVQIITDKGFGCIALTKEDGTLSGIITDGDIRRQIAQGGLLEKTAAEVMSKTPKTVSPETLVAESMAIMNDLKNTFRKITTLIVVDAENKPVGLLHLHDCLRAGFA